MLSSLEFGDPDARPHLLITGGVHGDEFEPMAAIRRLAARLRGAVVRGHVTLIPVVNEPAFERRARVGDDGLDLARTCPGRPFGTATERIAHTLAARIRSADFYIDLHTGGTRFEVWPLSGYTLHRNPEVLAQQRRMAHIFGLPLIWGTDPGLEGRSLSVARDAQVPAIYAEYLGGGRCDPAGVAAYERGCWNVAVDLGVVAGPIEPGGAEPPRVIEDSRPGAGHMQVDHPAPSHGFFTPHVQLGERVELGQRLGTVDDVLGEQPRELLARHAGVVVAIQTFPRVAAGEGIVVVARTS